MICAQEWWNWQTRRLQVPVVAIPCGFKSHLLHLIARNRIRVVQISRFLCNEETLKILGFFFFSFKFVFSAAFSFLSLLKRIFRFHYKKDFLLCCYIFCQFIMILPDFMNIFNREIRIDNRFCNHNSSSLSNIIS